VVKPSNFRDKTNMAYTRKEYISGIPGSKIVRFTMGNSSGKFSHSAKIVSIKAAQIRHNALEAARIAALRHFEKALDRKNFFLKIIPYPHQVLREHKRVNVAQADRFQEGMKKAYGKPMGVAARVDRRDTILLAHVDSENVNLAKEALRKAGNKLPVPVKIRTEKIGLGD
jgi:large subunit ribosomal protein L10e